MMRLTLVLPELERGEAVQHGPEARIRHMQFLAERKEPVAIIPVRDHDYRIISAVLLTECGGAGRSTSLKIKFKPIWCKMFTIYSNTNNALTAVVCEILSGQFWVDQQGFRPCRMTLNGHGTDPKIVEQSQYLLGDMLCDHPRPWILNSLIDMLQKNC